MSLRTGEESWIQRPGHAYSLDMAMMSSATECGIRSRDIIFMENKTLADWESNKKIINSDEIRTYLVERQTTLEEPASYDQDTESVAEEAEGAEIGTDQDSESDSDEEEIEEPVAEGQRWRYALREKGPQEISGCRACATDR